MPYFFILPALALLALIAIAGIIATRVYEPWRKAFPFLLWSCVGALIGFTAANVVVNGIGFVLVSSSNADSASSVETALKFGGLGLLMVGPFIASVVGVVIGGWLGFRRVQKRRV